MITGEYWKLHDDESLRKIEAASMHLLSKAGCRVNHEGMLDLLAAAGCRIDRGARRCWFPEKVVRDVAERLGRKTSEQVEIPAGWNVERRTGAAGSYPHLLDWPGGQRRLATKQDVRDLAKMAHVLEEFNYVGRVLNSSDVDQRIEPLWTTLALAQITNKTIGEGEIFSADYIEPLVRMGEVLSGKAGDASLVASCDFFIAPLIMDGSQAACFIEKRRFGLPIVPGTMPVSGISAPVTIAGTVAVAVAELLAGWVMGFACDPSLPAGGVVSSGSLDMRTVSACFGSPEAMLQNATVVSLCRRLYGVSVQAATPYVDCKRPGLEAVFQKMCALVCAPLGTGRNLQGWGHGLLSAGQDYSPVQHMLDLEIAEAVERFWGHYEVSDETIALDLIERMMSAGQTNFLDTEHTLAHYKAEQWYPRWFDRTPWQDGPYETEAERRMLQRIDRYCKDAASRYQRPALDESKLAELRRIFLSAERTILGSNSTPLPE
jgi:trimethylamine--corrinoid protein Co-methyltransferase